MSFESVINFWFNEIDPKKWFEKDESFDNLIKERFLETHTLATRSELFLWRNFPLGRLAEIIVLDQFSRNIYRNTSKAYKYDPMALILAQEAVKDGIDHAFNDSQKLFLYLPYMHSESSRIHIEAVKLFSKEGLEQGLDFELKHKIIIDRFGRYPHRNEALGRSTTEKEKNFLLGPDSSF